MTNLVTVKEFVTIHKSYDSRIRLFENINMKYYGQSQVPLEVSCSYEHQEAARRVVASHLVELYMTFDDDGKLVDVTVAKF